MSRKILLKLKARDTVHETNENVRLNLSPVFKDKLFAYLEEKLGAVRISGSTLKVKWQDDSLFVRDGGVIIIEGNLSKEELGKFQYRMRLEVAEIIFRELLSTFKCIFIKKSENVFEIEIPAVEINP